MSTPSKKSLSVFGLVMINVIAIDSLRSLPLNAEYGFGIVFFYILAAAFFFLPSAFVAAELATGWPETGGIYIWTREAFGNRFGFLTIWLQWFYNICWYPTIMSLIAATIAYVFDPSLVNNKTYMLIIIMGLFWGATAVNCLGMRASSMLSTVGALFGTLLPMALIIILGCVWVASGKPIAIHFSVQTFFPDLGNFHSLVLLTAVLYGLVGMEMSAAHAREVKNPQRDYPKAMIWSTIIILFSMILGSLAVAIIVPVHKLNIVAGLLEAFNNFFAAFHMLWFMPVLALLIVCGAIGGVAAWVLSPAKGLMMASRDGSLPKALGKTNRKQAPVRLLVIQGLIFTVLCGVFLLMPTVSSAFWVLTDITAILSLIVYVLMFSACLFLRYKHPEVHRSFRIPGGKIGVWLTCCLGLISCIFTIVLGFIPPSQIAIGSITRYETIVIIGVVVGCAVPFFVHWLTHKFKA